MKTCRHFVWTLLLLGLCGLFLRGGDIPAPQVVYYAAESQGVLCSFAEVQVDPLEVDGQPLLRLKTDLLIKLTALGAPLDTRIQWLYHVDPATGAFNWHQGTIRQGDFTQQTTIRIEGHRALIGTAPGDDTRELALPPDVILENGLYATHLQRDFGKQELAERQYQVLDVMEGRVTSLRYTLKETQDITLAGRDFRALVLDQVNPSTGESSQVWIDAATGLILKQVLANRTIFLADASVREHLRSANLDERVYIGTNAAIDNFSAIRYMKVQAVLRPIGISVTAADLSVPGQTFTGTVTGNLIDGVFEVRHERYPGEDPPTFPPATPPAGELARYLAPEPYIESGSPAIVELAHQLTAGVTDSWQAVRRISQWVADEIRYDIPGGVSALKTLELRRGECGAHSRLTAALCRSAGIPARVVWGCIYSPEKGGVFGQHGWNEVHMGAAGWIPIDSTARETDYIDSGHIRLGILSGQINSLNPEKMEIVDFEAGEQRMGKALAPAIPARYQPYVGEYEGPRGTFRVLVQNGRLAVDIPGKMIFELHDPDDQGRWTFTLTPAACLTFEEDAPGEISGMRLLSRSALPRHPGVEVTSAAAADPELRPYVAAYALPNRQRNISVVFREGHLALEGLGRVPIILEGPDAEGIWTGRPGNRQFSFRQTDDGPATALVVHEEVQLRKVAPAAANSR